mmetsp:Transcript_67490/g.170261  ORF Transcript_67490/g.170261 Transcript_67490/m.170261 type:complete len:376 (-) Transcript_67490:1443-2570(-)
MSQLEAKVGALTIAVVDSTIVEKVRAKAVDSTTTIALTTIAVLTTAIAVMTVAALMVIAAALRIVVASTTSEVVVLARAQAAALGALGSDRLLVRVVPPALEPARWEHRGRIGAVSSALVEASRKVASAEKEASMPTKASTEVASVAKEASLLTRASMEVASVARGDSMQTIALRRGASAAKVASMQMNVSTKVASAAKATSMQMNASIEVASAVKATLMTIALRRVANAAKEAQLPTRASNEVASAARGASMLTKALRRVASAARERTARQIAAKVASIPRVPVLTIMGRRPMDLRADAARVARAVAVARTGVPVGRMEPAWQQMRKSHRHRRRRGPAARVQSQPPTFPPRSLLTWRSPRSPSELWPRASATSS